MKETASVRIQSLDVLRALTMALMIFVNDIPGLGDSIPHWLHHAAYDEDMLGLSDIVFPLFLFCVGVSVPFALQRRLNRGESRTLCLGHVVERTIALLVMGLFASNSFNLTGTALGLPPQLLKILSVVAFFLIWNHYPQDGGKKHRLYAALVTVGWIVLGVLALLYVREPGEQDWIVNWGWLRFSMPGEGRYVFQFVAVLLMCVFLLLCRSWHSDGRSGGWVRFFTVVLLYLFLFKGPDAAGYVGLRPGWWQILGLIGWTYLLTSSVYLWIGPSVRRNLVAAGIALLVAALSVSGLLGPVKNYIPGNGAFHAFAFAGVVAGLWLQQYGQRSDFGALAKRLLAAAAVAFVGGWIAHRFWIISKLQETPSWVLYCLSIAFLCLLALHYVTDVRGKSAWFAAVRPAGVATLTCYLLPGIWYAMVSWLGIKYPAWATVGFGGIIRAVLFTVLIIAITAGLGKLKIRLKI